MSRRSAGVIINLIRMVAGRIIKGYEVVEEKVGDIMRGEYGIRLEWLEKYDAAVEKSITEGRAEGRADLLVSQVCRKLRKGKKYTR